MIADTRTNAGVDNFSSYRKLHTLANLPDRRIFLCTSGSLSMSQSVIGQLTEALPAPVGDEAMPTVATAPSMFRVAELVGEAVQSVNRSVGAVLAEASISSSVALLLGGRIGDEPPSLYLVYSAGNFIHCSPESPFLQIGETKYGKPILDRGIRHGTPLEEAVKVALLSFDSAGPARIGPPHRSRRFLFQRIVAALGGASPRSDRADPQPPLDGIKPLHRRRERKRGTVPIFRPLRGRR
jgi:putative proteasome-type protease